MNKNYNNSYTSFTVSVMNDVIWLTKKQQIYQLFIDVFNRSRYNNNILYIIRLHF